MGGTKISGLILSPSCCSLSLLSLLENHALLETWRCSKRAPSLNIWPSLNIEPTLSQISEETLESLKLRERNSRASNSTQSQPTNKGHPQSDVTRRRHVGFLQPARKRNDRSASFQLKSKYETTSIPLELVVFISKVKIIEFSS